MADDEVIKRRLMIDGDGTGDDRRLTILLKTLVKWSSADDTSAESSTILQRMFTQIDQCGSSMVKSRAAACMMSAELDNYSNVDSKIATNTELALKDIENTKAKVVEAKTVRKNRIEYDVLAKVINEQRDRKETNEKLSQLDKDLQSVEKVNKVLDRKLDIRRKEIHVLFSSCHRLKAMLEQNECDKISDDFFECSDDEEKQDEIMEVIE